MKRYVAVGLVLGLMLVLSWLAVTDHPAVWPVRNTVQYRLTTWFSGPITEPAPEETGRLTGVVYTEAGQPIAGAWVLVAHRSGATYSARTDALGHYLITNIPPGAYRPVAGAPGYADVQFGRWFRTVTIRGGETTAVDATLPEMDWPEVTPGADFQLSEPATLTCTEPLPSQASERQVSFTSAGRPNQPAFYYTPVTATLTSQLPLLLAVYPGPADSWRCASIPLAAAGYGVLAAGPAYSFDLEADVDELERLLRFARDDRFPGSDGRRIALLGGSYSSLHVQQLLRRGQPHVRSAVLLGPPTDLFDMRRRLENGTYVPPFGLDQALIALGFPDQAPLRYWRYSGAYHVRADFPPLAVLHSRSDDVVPYQQSELLVNNLEVVGAPYEAHFFDAASHYLMAEGGDADTLKIYDITLAFLDKTLRAAPETNRP